MKKILYVVLISILMLPNSVRAACSYADNSRLQRLASNIGFSYEPYEINGTVKFKIDIVNIPKELKIKDVTKMKWHYPNANGIITISDYAPGTSIVFALYVANGNCKESKLTTKYVSLPYFNAYYNTPLCENITDYKLCHKWANTSTISKTEFERNVKAYRASLEKPPVIEPTPLPPTLLEKAWKIFKKYFIIIIGIPIIFTTILIYKRNRKNSFDL